jgi:hypothetical protein
MLASEQQTTLWGVMEQIRIIKTEIGQLIRGCGIVEADLETAYSTEGA